MKKVLVVTGQTATGKTNYALELAAKYNGELINCDSRQIYKGLDIVTGKDINTGQFQLYTTLNGQNIGFYNVISNEHSTKIWLYDIVTPDIVFSSIDYVNCCLPVIQHLFSQGKTPIIVGGSYYYLKHLLYNTPEQGVDADWDLREILEKKPVEELQQILAKKYPSAWEKLNPSDRMNPRRLIRRLEVLQNINEEDYIGYEQKKDIDLVSKLGLHENISTSITGFYNENREQLRTTIQKRVLKRLEDGAVEETKQLLEHYSLESPGLQSIGYKQIAAFLKNIVSENQLIEEWTNKEYQYAKRQYTFMKQDSHISWINIG